MKVVYFFDKDSTLCPVKKYLEQFISNKKDTNKDNQRKNKLLAEIDQKIEYIRERNGKAIPPIAKPLMGYKFFEIRGGK
ncbi:MAG: hypothetical protein Q8O87_02060, partial [bacterium]|nr:hypothetical protein [bacterium]